MKKDFKEKCSFHVYGKGKGKINAIYYDWKSDFENGAVGFKYMVNVEVGLMSKSVLFTEFYNWVIHEVSLQYFIQYRYAIHEKDRFKVSLTEKIRAW